MSWIETIGEEEAGRDAHLAELYAQMLDPTTGRIDNVLKVHSLNPEGMAAHWAVYRAAMRGTSGLRRVEREMIAVVVSARNDCHY